MVQPVKGARYCSGAGSDAVAATTIEYSIAPLLFEHLDELRDGRALLADGDVDAVELLVLVGRAALIGFWLRMVSSDDGGLAGLAVADDQLALAAADRDQRVDGLEAGLHRLVHRLARDDAGRLHVDAASARRVDRALAVDRVAERVDDAAEQALADRARRRWRRCA